MTGMTNEKVAVSAKKTPDYTGSMIMVDMRTFTLTRTAENSLEAPARI